MTSSGIELRIGNKYRVGRKIGSGSFGDIYLGENRKRVFFFSQAVLCVGFVRGQHESIRVTKINSSSTFAHVYDDAMRIDFALCRSKMR